MSRRASVLVLAAWLLAVASAEAIVIRHDADTADYQALAADPAFDSVGFITINANTETPKLQASAVLVHPQYVLTAAHFGLGNASGRQFTVAGETRSIVQKISHPDFDGDTAGGWDLALLRLDEPITSVAPAALYEAPVAEGMLGTYVGYGETGDGNFGAQPDSRGVKLAGTNVIDQIGGEVVFTTQVRNYSPRTIVSDFDRPNSDNFNPLGSAEPTPLEMLVALGDSGGALFVEDEGQYFLAGTHSFVDPFPSLFAGEEIRFDYGDVNGTTGIYESLDWIRSVLPVAGDFDGDGDVDAFDLGVWQSGFGTTQGATAAHGDADFDGDVDAFDLAVWQTHFGTGTAAAAPNPEPATLALFALAGVAALRRIHRPRRS